MLGAAIAVVLASLQPSQEERDVAADLRALNGDALLGGAEPFAHVHDTGGLSRAWVQVDFAVSQADEVLARRTRASLHAAPRTDYARARTCPALTGVVLQLEELTPPHIQVPRIGREAHRPRRLPMTDGGGVRVWGGASDRGNPEGEVVITDNVGVGPGAFGWAMSLTRATNGCWRSEPPAP